MSEHDPMEDLFRDRAESYEYPFNEKDWSALEARLDREMPTRGGNFWGYALSTLLLVSIPWWPWNIENHQSAPSNTTEQTMPAPAAADESISVTHNSTNSVSEDATDLAAQTESSNLSTSSQSQTPTSTTTEVSPQTNTQSTNLTTSPSGPSSSNTSVSFADAQSDGASSEDSQAESKRKAIEHLHLNSLSLNRDGLAMEATLIPNDESPNTIEELIDAPHAVTSDFEDGGEIVSSEKDKGWQTWRPFVLVGSEYGGTQMNNSPSLGFRAGAGIRYQPFEQWSASIGVNYANIGYTAYGEEYKLAYELPQYHNLDWTDGHCYMFEFPIEVRWHPLNWLNIGTGLRSYYIQRETYDLYVKNDYGPTEKHGVEYEVPHSALMAHWIISAGFAVPVGKDYVEIKPFYQVPLKGVGHGSVWWNSAGVSMMYLF